MKREKGSSEILIFFFSRPLFLEIFLLLVSAVSHSSKKKSFIMFLKPPHSLCGDYFEIKEYTSSDEDSFVCALKIGIQFKGNGWKSLGIPQILCMFNGQRYENTVRSPGVSHTFQLQLAISIYHSLCVYNCPVATQQKQLFWGE